MASTGEPDSPIGGSNQLRTDRNGHGHLQTASKVNLYILIPFKTLTFI